MTNANTTTNNLEKLLELNYCELLAALAAVESAGLGWNAGRPLESVQRHLQKGWLTFADDKDGNTYAITEAADETYLVGARVPEYYETDKPLEIINNDECTKVITWED